MNVYLFSALFVLASFSGGLVQANEDKLLSEARSLAVSMPPKLMTVLQAQISQSGTAGAIAVCKETAPKIAAEISENSGWKVKRVSLKARNESRATPDAWEQAALEEFDARLTKGETASQLEKGERVGQEYRYLKALPVQALCLECHGPLEQIDPAVRNEVKKLYPNDQATGYSLGQIRGAISVRKSVAEN